MSVDSLTVDQRAFLEQLCADIDGWCAVSLKDGGPYKGDARVLANMPWRLRQAPHFDYHDGQMWLSLPGEHSFPDGPLLISQAQPYMPVYSIERKFVMLYWFLIHVRSYEMVVVPTTVGRAIEGPSAHERVAHCLYITKR